jgi:hypothetical protein
MPFHAPFILGPFMVDAEGRLTPRDPEAPPAFIFRWRGRPVRVHIVRAQNLRPDESDGRLRLQATLGRVPSTAHGTQPALRPRSFSVMRELRRLVPPEWRVRLSPDHRALLEAEAEIALPITATGLLTEVTLFLLGLAPYLDLLDEAGIAANA